MCFCVEKHKNTIPVLRRIIDRESKHLDEKDRVCLVPIYGDSLGISGDAASQILYYTVGAFEQRTIHDIDVREMVNSVDKGFRADYWRHVRGIWKGTIRQDDWAALKACGEGLSGEFMESTSATVHRLGVKTAGNAGSIAAIRGKLDA